MLRSNIRDTLARKAGYITMSVSDWSSDFGLGPSLTQTNTIVYSSTQYDNDGNLYNQSTSTQANNVITGYRGRFFPSTNPPDNQGWRGQSRYRRHAVIMKYNGGQTGTRSVLDNKGVITTSQSQLPDEAFGYLPLYSIWGSSQGYTEDYYGDTNIALNQALIGLSGGGAQIGTALAETHKTFSDLADLAIELAELYRGFRTFNLPLITRALSGGGRDIWDTLSKRWLYYQYAWRPLVQDIHDTFQVIKEKRLVKFNHVHHASSKNSDWDYIDPEWSDDIGSNPVWPTASGGYWHKCHATHRARVKLYASIRNETVVFINQLGLLNPVSIAWELVPFSFVADWIVPVGACLQAWSSMAGLDFRGGSISQSATSDAQVKWRPSSGYKTVPYGAVSGTMQGSYYNRDIITRWPIPSLGIQNPLSTGHIANAAALVAQMR